MVISVVGLVRVLEGEIDIFYGLFQTVERMEYIARSMMIRGPLSVALFTLGMFLTDRLAAGVLGWLLATLILFLIHDLRLGRKIAPTPVSSVDSVASFSANWRNIRPVFDWRVMSHLAYITV